MKALAADASRQQQGKSEHNQRSLSEHCIGAIGFKCLARRSYVRPGMATNTIQLDTGKLVHSNYRWDVVFTLLRAVNSTPVNRNADVIASMALACWD